MTGRAPPRPAPRPPLNAAGSHPTAIGRAGVSAAEIEAAERELELMRQEGEAEEMASE